MANLLVFDVSNLACRVFHTVEHSIKDERLIPFSRARLKKSIAAMIRDVDPIRVVAALDDSTPSFRHQLMPGVYKAQRAEKSSQLKEFLKSVPEVFGEFGIELLVSPGYEADDVMATVADQCLAVGGWRVHILSNDADMLSCIHDSGDGKGVFVLRAKEGSYQLWGPEEVVASPKFGVIPNRLSMFKCVAGDASDNLSGCPGLGPVAARRLASVYPSVKRLFAALENDPKDFTKLERNKLTAWGLDNALLSERMTKLVRSAPLRTY